MLNIQKTFQGHPVRIVEVDGLPHFVLADVCRVLDLTSPHKVASRLDEDEKGRTQIPTPGGLQEVATVSESGLYAVILRSDKPQARPFRKWITAEVLPALRQSGTYTLPGEREARVLPGLISTRALSDLTGLTPRSVRKRAQRHGLTPAGLTRPASLRPSYLYPLPDAGQVFELPAHVQAYTGPVFPFAGKLPFQSVPPMLPTASTMTAKKDQDARALALHLLATAEELTRTARALLEEV